MTDLTNALNRIFAWLEKNSPSTISGFKPGLSSEEIEEKLSALPFRVAEEVRELYRWRNGDEMCNTVFGHLWLMSLDTACEYSEYFNDEDMIEIREGDEKPRYLFPIFSWEDSESFSIQGSESMTTTGPIFHMIYYADSNFVFISLTAMMLTLAECYETGVYAVGEYGIEMVDGIEFDRIRRKYNPGTDDFLYSSH